MGFILGIMIGALIVFGMIFYIGFLSYKKEEAEKLEKLEEDNKNLNEVELECNCTKHPTQRYTSRSGHTCCVDCFQVLKEKS